MKQIKRNMWQHPWQYKESIAFTAGMIAVGYILQLTNGNFDFQILQAPVNIITGVLIILMALISYFFRGNKFIEWLSGTHLTVILLSALVTLGIIMGLTSQIPDGANVPHESQSNFFFRLGFTRMTSSWPFVIIYFLTLISLGALIARKVLPLNKVRAAFLINHLGIWILLFSAGLGASDLRRFVMHVRKGEVEWQVYNENKVALELPIAIKLNDFIMEEYPPKIVVIDRMTGAVQPEDAPIFLHIDKTLKQKRIGKWEITMLDYIHDAVRNSDSTYHEIKMPGSSPATKLHVKDLRTGEENEGWVCAGNISQLYMVLNLDSAYSVAATSSEPQRFISDIEVYTQDGQTKHKILEVNKPCKIGNWVIYQYGYDNDAGKLSTYSSFELVYDPWIIPVYIGIILMGIGSVMLIWQGRKRKEDNNEMG